MSVDKRLSKLESQLGKHDDKALNIMLIGFVQPGELDKRITHIWSKGGTDDCYMVDGETGDEFRDRAAKYIREFNNINERHVLLMFGDSEVMQTQTQI